MLPRLLVALGAFALFAYRLSGYTFTGSRWTVSTVTMQLQLGPGGSVLTDGSASWGASAEDALALWNNVIAGTRFAVVRDSTAPKAQGNRTNNVFFSSNVYGEAWGNGVLAVTLTFSSSSSQTTECDVLFNNTLTWDSYRGSLRYGSGGAVYDFHRVALHEFGHVLGLDHPDAAGQRVTAMMNSTISNLDSLAADDISGAQSLYGANSTTTGSPPTITSQPTSQAVTVGQNASFFVGASSTTTMSYQWLKNGTAIGGATSATLTLTSVSSSSAGSYAAVVSNGYGSTISAAATLTVTASPPPPTPAVPPSIATSPASQTVVAGSAVTFTVSASGTSTLSYSWRRNGTVISGATAASYTIGSVQSADAGSYTVTVANVAGSATSAPATLTVATAPKITSAPSAQVANVGSRVVFSVAATGSPAPSYQWLRDGAPIANATGAELVFAVVTLRDTGSYAVIVSNPGGSVTTSAVQLTINASQLVNLSTRGFVPSGGALTTGFVVRGNAEKTLLVRGIGPTLSTFDVAGALTNPRLELIAQDTATTIATNDSWGEAVPALTSAFQAVGAFPLPTGSADAAAEIRLAPGAYTTRITADTSGSSGVALAEIYDTETPGTGARLVNVSTLGYSGTGDQALTVGFAVQGNAPKRVLIRAVGPGLAPFGVAGRLADPRLTVFPLGQPEIASNGDWAGTAELTAAFASVGAFTLANNSHDSAAVLTLAPGGYTVVVTGTGGTTGNVLVEIYDFDP